MPISPILLVFGPGNKPLSGPVEVVDPDSADLCGSEVEEFMHRVYTVRKDYFYSLLYGVDFVRKHEPMVIIKQIDKLSVPLLDYLKAGTFLPKIEIRWYQYNPRQAKTEEYFRMTLEHVRLHSLRLILPDAKAETFERYGHLEEVQLMYQKITWLYLKGHLVHTDIWNNGFFTEEDEKEFGGKKTADDEEPIETPLVEPLTLKFTSGIFEEPKDGFGFDKKVTVKFTYEVNRKPDYKENKVYAKLYAVYNGKTEDLAQINEGRLVAGNCWSTEFTLKKPQAFEKDKERKDDAVVEYYAEIENQAAGGSYRSSLITIGLSAPVMQNMAWKSPAARRDETVSLEAEFKGCKEGEQATIEIVEYDNDGNHDPVEKIQSKVTNGKLEAGWKFVYEEDTDDIMSEEEAKKTGGKYNPPEYFFTVEIGQNKWGDKQESGLLQFKDWIEVELQDENGKALTNEPFELHLPDGSKQNGSLDEKGFARVESVPPGPVEVVFTNYPSATMKK